MRVVTPCGGLCACLGSFPRAAPYGPLVITRWLTGRPQRRSTQPRPDATPVRPRRLGLAASVTALTAAAVFPVGLATVMAPPAEAATTVTDFNMPAGGVARIALTPDGSAYNVNANANTVSRVTDDGEVTEVVASVPGMPMGIVAAANGTVYTAQYLGKTIAKIAPNGQVTPAWASLPYNGYSLAIDPAGNLYTANPGGQNVSKVAPDGTVTANWGPVGTQAVFLAVDPLGGVVTANSNGSLTRLDANGAPTVLRGATGAMSVGVAAGPDGTTYVVDPDRTITRISHAGVVTPAWATV